MSARKPSFLFAIIALAIISTIVLGFWTRQKPWNADYSKWPPAGVFQMVLGEPPPRGVTAIEVSGRGYLWKKWFWIRFQATRPAMDSLASLGDRLTDEGMQRDLKAVDTANSRYNDVDETKVNWSDVERVADPVAYEGYNDKGAPENSEFNNYVCGWLMILDYKNHTVYIQAHADS